MTPAKRMKGNMDDSKDSKDSKDGVSGNEDESEALEQIDACQNEIDALNEKASEEILKVEQKYNKMRKPFYEKRNDIIKRIPNFWVTAFINHPQISGIMEEEEEECLHALIQLDVEEFEDIKSGYRINFHFKENSFLTNSILTKEFFLAASNGPTSTSTPIQWKDGKDLQKILHIKTAANKRKRHLEYKTFFEWFSDNSDPVNDEIAELMKDDIWPNPLQYYLVPDVEVEADEEQDEEEPEHSSDGEELGDEENFDEDDDLDKSDGEA